MILISNFYNESYLLPWWLEHNKKYFDHGVMINYRSTDDSVDIIKEICPTWEIRDTRNPEWDSLDEDAEFMDIEREFEGYKMILTLTEFLIGAPKLDKRCLKIPIKRMVDRNPEQIPAYDLPLIEQKKDGYFARKNKYRFLHNYSYGAYLGAGRHKTSHENFPCDLVIWKYVFSPWTEEFIQRRLQFKKNMSERHLKGNIGHHHKLSREQLEKQYRKEINEVR